MTFYTPSAATSAGIQNAIDAADSAGGGTVLLESADYQADALGVVIPSGVHLEGLGRARIVAPSSGSANLIALAATSAISVSLAPATSLPAFTRDIPLASVTGVSVGKLLGIQKNLPGGLYQITCHEITAIAGNIVSVMPEVLFSMANTDTLTLSVMTAIDDVSINGISFNGNGNAGMTRAILASNHRGLTLSNLKCEGFAGAAAVYVSSGLGAHVENIALTRCGSAGESDFVLWGNTQTTGGGIKSRFATGFGPQIQWGSLHQLNGISAYRANGRGVKLAGVLHSQINSVIGHDNLYTGISVSLGTQYCTGYGWSGCYNHLGAPGNNVGIWFSDQNNINNTITGAVALGNATSDISVFASDTGNVIRPARWGTLYNAGGATVSAT